MPAQPRPHPLPDRWRPSMIALEASGLAGGGRRTTNVVDRLDLLLAAGGKVGWSAGTAPEDMDPPRLGGGGATGRRDRRSPGAVGYLRQDPRQHRVDDAATGIEHPPRAARRAPARGRESRLRLKSILVRGADRAVRLAGGAVRGRGGYRGGGGRPDDRGGTRLAQDRLSLPVGGAVGRRAPPPRAGADPVRGSDLLLLDEPTNHLDADAKAMADAVPRRLPGRAPRREPRPRPPRRLDHADPPSRPRRRRRVPGQGTYSQYLTARDRDEARSPRSRPGRRPRSRG